MIPEFIEQAKINILMPNYEYLIYQPTRKRDIMLLRRVNYVICKTRITARYCEEIKKEYGFTYEIIYTRHTTPIKKIHNPKRNIEKWLHAAGISPWKQTDSVLNAWVKHPEWPELVVVCRDRCKSNISNIDISRAKNITFMDYMEDLNTAQSKILNHICPSIIEGYGHYLNEARAYGAFILTSDYEPMNELVTVESGQLIPCSMLVSKPKSPVVKMCIINCNDMERAVEKALQTPISERVKLGKNAKKAYEADTKFFNTKMSSFVKKLELHFS
jgi:hypothetical protein